MSAPMESKPKGTLKRERGPSGALRVALVLAGVCWPRYRWLRRTRRLKQPSPARTARWLSFRDSALDPYILMIRALKDLMRGATAGLLDAPGITLEAEAEISLLPVLVCWTYSRSARSEPA
jgi:hypothetical protein